MVFGGYEVGWRVTASFAEAEVTIMVRGERSTTCVQKMILLARERERESCINERVSFVMLLRKSGFVRGTKNTTQTMRSLPFVVVHLYTHKYERSGKGRFPSF